MLASADGYFYIYNIPEQVFSLALIPSPEVRIMQGGDCVMVKQHRLDPECGGEVKMQLSIMNKSFEIFQVEENEGSANRDCPAVIPVSQVCL